MRAILIAAACAAACAAQPARFHHVHLNTTDPAKAIEFYAGRFDCEKAKLGGMNAVKAQDVWLLFAKVAQAPPWELVSAIWHIGWGAEDMQAAYQKQLDMGTKFYTPLTDISKLTGTQGFYYAYVDGPDHALVELNTAAHHHFGHLHLFSEDPIAAGEFYMKYFGAVRRGANRPISREPRFYEGYQVGPSMSLMSGQVNIIIFPAQHARQANPKHWEGRTGFAPTEGRAIDHVSFAVANLDEALAQLRTGGVKVTAEPRAILDGSLKSAFVEGPDKIRIEVVEDRTR